MNRGKPKYKILGKILVPFEETHGKHMKCEIEAKQGLPKNEILKKSKEIFGIETRVGKKL